MAHSSNSEPRRFWRARTSGRDRSRCAGCGARATVHSSTLPLCTSCLESARQGQERPIVHIAVADAACRSQLMDALHRQGWNIVEKPTGFHLLQGIADAIDDDAPGPAQLPDLIVVDAISRGCAGVTIAAGLRDLGVRIPLVLVAKPGDPVIESDDPAIRVVGPSHAASALAEVARGVSQLQTFAERGVPLFVASP